MRIGLTVARRRSAASRAAGSPSMRDCATMLVAGLREMALVLAVAWASPLVRARTLREAHEPRQTESVTEELAG
jgi:hypothetical protein